MFDIGVKLELPYLLQELILKVLLANFSVKYCLKYLVISIKNDIKNE